MKPTVLQGCFPVIYRPLDWPDLHIHPILESTGWIVLYGGLVIMFGRIINPGIIRAFDRKQNLLKESGFYRLSRNPRRRSLF